MKYIVENWRNTLRIEGKPDEWESKNLLKQIGLNVPNGYRILPGETVDLKELVFPLVLKVCDPEIIHKTEQGGVILNVTSDNFSQMIQGLQKKFPSSPMLAEAMCRIEGTEFILGGIIDPVFGPAVMAGAGGVLTEIYEDAVFRLCPCSKNEAKKMLKELRISPVLNGYRGSRLDLDKLADVVSSVSRMFDAFDGKLNQIDINPIVYSGDRWTALDCIFIMNS